MIVCNWFVHHKPSCTQVIMSVISLSANAEFPEHGAETASIGAHVQVSD